MVDQKKQVVFFMGVLAQLEFKQASKGLFFSLPIGLQSCVQSIIGVSSLSQMRLAAPSDFPWIGEPDTWQRTNTLGARQLPHEPHTPAAPRVRVSLTYSQARGRHGVRIARKHPPRCPTRPPHPHLYLPQRLPQPPPIMT